MSIKYNWFRPTYSPVSYIELFHCLSQNFPVTLQISPVRTSLVDIPLRLMEGRTLATLIRPALLIIDMQNAFCHPLGTLVQSGVQIPPSTIDSITLNINTLRAVFHARNLPVIFVGYAFDEGYSNAGILLDDVPHLKKAGFCIRGSWDAAVIDALKPAPEKEEIVLEKYRNSAFAAGTQLDELLRVQGVQEVVCCGVATNVCVESTVREGVSKDWKFVTVGEACGAVSKLEQEATLRNLAWFGGVVDCEDIVKVSDNMLCHAVRATANGVQAVERL